MDREGAHIVRESILEAVDTQLRDGNPPETRKALDRLMRQGHLREDARILIARVLAAEMFEIMKHKRHHDPGKYARALEDLPREEIYGGSETEEGADGSPATGTRE